MTAEILIMNKSAIAMAADSVVTVTKGKKRKTYEGVNKLFMLLNDPPMGIMTYGNANLADIPMEILIKEYKKNIQDSNKFSTRLNKIINGNNVENIMKNFLKFVKKYCKENSDDTSDSIVKNYIYYLNNLIEKFGKESIKIFLERFQKYANKKLLKLYKGTDFKEYKEIFNKLLDDLEIPKNEKKEYETFLKKHLLVYTYNNSSTGIVIAGFDNKKPYPSFCSQYFFAYYNKKIHSVKIKNEKINNKNSACIEPFAQTDVIEAYFEGINNEVSEKLKNYLEETLKEYPDAIYNIIKEIDGIDESILGLIRDNLEKINDYNDDIIKNFTKTLEKAKDYSFESAAEAMAVLPKEELGNMCESLIHITSLKRKVSPEIETVGGDIDVALITKGDGFVWIKRKHYFDPNLNYHFFER